MNTPEEYLWNYVPEEKEYEWRKAFLKARNEKVQLKLNSPCPICFKLSLYHYFEHGLWEWCDQCLTYAHYSAKSPEWYKTKIDHSKYKLTVYPTALVKAILDNTIKFEE